jgi:hypothetical protein
MNSGADGLRFRQWPVIENQSCGQFRTGEEKSLVRHYPYFLFTICDIRFTRRRDFERRPVERGKKYAKDLYQWNHKTRFGVWKKLRVYCLDFRPERIQFWGIRQSKMKSAILTNALLIGLALMSNGCALVAPPTAQQEIDHTESVASGNTDGDGLGWALLYEALQDSGQALADRSLPGGK